jgi:carbamoyltransferase
VWVQPAAGDAGTALGAALHVSRELGCRPAPMVSAALGRGWSDAEIAAALQAAGVPFERPDSLTSDVADVLAAGGVVGWFQGRSEYGPRALGHRSLLASPARQDMTQRLNEVKGRERFRPVAPMVLTERATEVFEGVIPSHPEPVHAVRPPGSGRMARPHPRRRPRRRYGPRADRRPR